MSRTLTPEGFYDAEITGHSFEKASTGTLMFVLNIEVQTDGGVVRRKYRRYLTENSGEKFIEDLKKVGFVGNWQSLYPTAKQPASLIGKQCRVQCRHEMYNGEQREQWSIVRRGSKAPEAATLDDLKAFATLAKISSIVADEEVPF